jgi:hypothetical protein
VVVMVDQEGINALLSIHYTTKPTEIFYYDMFELGKDYVIILKDFPDSVEETGRQGEKNTKYFVFKNAIIQDNKAKIFTKEVQISQKSFLMAWANCRNKPNPIRADYKIKMCRKTLKKLIIYEAKIYTN